jgi:hypothetical protein
MPLDPARFLPAPASYDRPPRPADPSIVRYPVTAYDPLTTLGPRRYEVDYGTGTFRDATPRAGGGYSTYDYGTGQFGSIRPRPGGGFSID